MKKFFCTETDEPIMFGDVLTVTFTKDVPNGTVTIDKDVEFIPDTAKWLIDAGFVEEREEKEEEEVNIDRISFDSEDLECPLEAFITDFEALEERVDKLEELTMNVTKELVNVIKSITEEKVKETSAQSNKSQSKKK